MSALTKNIKKLRALKGLNQTEFAKLFDLTRANIASYEEGRAQPKMDAVLKMANYFELSLEQFVNKELSVNDLSKFPDPESVSTIETNGKDVAGFVRVPYLEESELTRYLSIGRARSKIVVPAAFGADLAWLYESAHLQSARGIEHGDVLLLEKTPASAVQNGLIYTVLHRKQMITGIGFIIDDTLELRGTNVEKPLLSIPLKSVQKVWKMKGRLTNSQVNYQNVLLEERIADLEKMLQGIMGKK